MSNLAVVPVDADGSFCIFNQTAVHLVVDLQGGFSPIGHPGVLPDHAVPRTRHEVRAVAAA